MNPEGVLLVDKPLGPTSHDVVGQVRRALKTRRVGHAGTLDPAASGLMVVLVGRYTKLSSYLTSDDKGYLATVTFGTRTTTDDAEGEVVAEGDPSDLDEDKVRNALAQMVGEVDQVPPVFSAISIGGERLYKKARRGETVDVPPRRVTIKRLQLFSWQSASAEVEVECSKGTYVRAIARDLGETLGVPAHLSALRRTKSGGYSVDEAVTIESLSEASLRTGPDAVRGMPQVDIDEDIARRLTFGQAVAELKVEGPSLAIHDGALHAIVHEVDGVTRVLRGLWK